VTSAVTVERMAKPALESPGTVRHKGQHTTAACGGFLAPPQRPWQRQMHRKSRISVPQSVSPSSRRVSGISRPVADQRRSSQPDCSHE
jgi:hypothetical protein